tara:strand:- start:317 stop:1063 length:747 start_codon:yes stop_codon:yes gene_type:complete
MTISKIVYINLEHRTDRKEIQEEQLKASGIPYERFDAICPTYEQLVPEDGEYHEFFKRSVPRIRDYMLRENKARGRGVFGVYLSHYKILQRALEEGWGDFLILEDDAVFGEETISDLVSAANNEEYSDWDIIRDVWVAKRDMELEKLQLSSRKASTVYLNGKAKGLFRHRNSDIQSKFYSGPPPNIVRWGGAHFQLIRAKSLKKILDFMDKDHVYNIDSIYCTNQLNVYWSKFGLSGFFELGTDIPKD